MHTPYHDKFKKNGYWYSFNDFLTQRFGEKVYKVTVSAGFTCPTRDGTRGDKGCAFCDERGSSSFFSAERAFSSIQDQIAASIPGIKARFRAHKFLAYFQSFTNTYGPLAYLQQVYDAALNYPDIVGLCIGTRPDCIPNEALALIDSYGHPNRLISLELGLQSFREDALIFYDRGHTAAEGIDGVQRALKFKNINVAVHLMFGAPGDTVETAIDAAKRLNDLGVHGVKIHQLMILKDTVLATRYAVAPFHTYSINEYNEIAIAFLEHLSPDIHVERTHALSSHPDELVAPHWASDRFTPLNALKAAFESRQSRQGHAY